MSTAGSEYHWQHEDSEDDDSDNDDCDEARLEAIVFHYVEL